jgi:hypothetical protein
MSHSHVLFVAVSHPSRVNRFVFTEHVRRDLVGCLALPAGRVPLEGAAASPQISSEALAGFAGRVVGIAIVRPLWAYDVLKYLGPDRRMRDNEQCITSIMA